MNLQGPYMAKEMPSITTMLLKQDMLPFWSDGTRVTWKPGRGIVKNGMHSIYFAPHDTVLRQDAKALKGLVDKRHRDRKTATFKPQWT